MQMATTQNLITVSDVAEMTGKTSGRIRQIAIEHEIGTCYHNRLRLFTKAEAAKIAKIIAGNGRSRKNSENED
jgi:hypothetical protein